MAKQTNTKNEQQQSVRMDKADLDAFQKAAGVLPSPRVSAVFTLLVAAFRLGVRGPLTLLQDLNDKGGFNQNANTP